MNMNSSTSCNKLQKQGGKLLVLPAGGVVYVKLIRQKKNGQPHPSGYTWRASGRILIMV